MRGDAVWGDRDTWESNGGQVLTVKDKELENLLDLGANYLGDAAMEERRTRRTPVYVAPIKGSHLLGER